MKHLFVNSDGETVAADTSEQAKAYFDELSGYPEDDEWCQVNDDEPFAIRDCETDEVKTKLAREWASEESVPNLVLTTYTE